MPSRQGCAPCVHVYVLAALCLRVIVGDASGDDAICSNERGQCRNAAADRPWWDAEVQDLDGDGDTGGEEARRLWEETRDYMTNVVASSAEYDAVRDGCRNLHERCTLWAAGPGGCDEDPEYMYLNCAPACKSCDMLQVVPAFWDAKEQEFEGSDEAEALWEGTYDYMTDVVATGAEYDAVRDECQNRHERCTLWATKGECEANPRFMKVQCAPACRSCEMLDVRRRCPVDPNDRDLFQGGDLDRMYERILRDFSVYEPQVLSRPGGDPDDDPSIVDGPWMVTLENFVGDEEANELIAAAHSVGFQPSTEFIQKEDGTYERQVTKTRTSMGVFCFDECLRDHPITMQFSETIEKLTGAPRNHTTFPQFLKYEEGQSFHKHSDFDPRHLDLQHGGRIMTILTYLSDVEEGGETHFPYLNITVTPRRGRIVLFPLVMNGDPNEEDVRTHHEGQKIKSGVKYAVSMYVHQKDFKNTWRKGCIG